MTADLMSRPAVNNGSVPDHQSPAPDSPAAVSQNAVLVNLHIRNWSETATDQNATDQVAQANNVAPGSGRYVKRLLNKRACEEVRRLGQDARKTHNDLTMPWDDQGTRLLPIKAYQKYRESIQNLMERRIEATNRLLFNYQDHIEQAEQELGALFNPNDYPTAEELREAITMDWEFGEVPDGQHFRADLPEHERRRIQKDIEQRVAARINHGLEDLFRRLSKAVTAASERLSGNGDGSDKVFKNTLVTNLKGIVDNIPLLNVTSDPVLEGMAQQLQNAMDGLDPDNLRPNNKNFDAAKRERFKTAVDEMAEQFSGYFGD